MGHKIKLIVGLGNPGRDHAGDRHNVGADFVELLARDQHCSLSEESKFFGFTGKFFAGQDIRLLVPTTYMNLSGKAVAALANFFKIEPDNILVVHDELDIAPGEIRFKIGGGHGGHNGLRDIISQMGNNKNFARLRIGIGHPGNAKQVSNYVLSSPSKTDRDQIESAMTRTLHQINNILAGDHEKVMRELHTQNA